MPNKTKTKWWLSQIFKKQAKVQHKMDCSPILLISFTSFNLNSNWVKPLKVCKEFKQIHKSLEFISNNSSDSKCKIIVDKLFSSLKNHNLQPLNRITEIIEKNQQIMKKINQILTHRLIMMS